MKMRGLIFAAVLLCLLPLHEAQKNGHYISRDPMQRRAAASGQPPQHNNNNPSGIQQQQQPPLRRSSFQELLSKLLTSMKRKLEAKGIKTKFMEKTLNQREPLSVHGVEEMIKEAQRKVAKKVQEMKKAQLRKAKGLGASRGLASRSGLSKSYSSRTQFGRSPVRGNLNPCPTGQERVKGSCKCPYLSYLNSENKCRCIYGTYRDSNGNCQSYY